MDFKQSHARTLPGEVKKADNLFPVKHDFLGTFQKNE